MFEGWVSDLLAAYLGQFLDVQREQLRISLFKGEFSSYLLLFFSLSLSLSLSPPDLSISAARRFPPYCSQNTHEC